MFVRTTQTVLLLAAKTERKKLNSVPNKTDGNLEESAPPCEALIDINTLLSRSRAYPPVMLERHKQKQQGRAAFLWMGLERMEEGWALGRGQEKNKKTPPTLWRRNSPVCVLEVDVHLLGRSEELWNTRRTEAPLVQTLRRTFCGGKQRWDLSVLDNISDLLLIHLIRAEWPPGGGNVTQSESLGHYTPSTATSQQRLWLLCCVQGPPWW